MSEDVKTPPPAPSARRASDVWKRLQSGDDEGDLDMTPMVDVTFLLLIFFMITAAFMLQKAIQVPPTDDSAAAAVQVIEDLEDDSIVVRIDGDNIYWVICPAWAEEEKAVSKQDMRNLVRSARRGAPPGESGAADTPGYSKLLVQANGDATHEYVVAALDAGSGASVEEIRLMKVEDEF